MTHLALAFAVPLLAFLQSCMAFQELGSYAELTGTQQTLYNNCRTYYSESVGTPRNPRVQLQTIKPADIEAQSNGIYKLNADGSLPLCGFAQELSDLCRITVVRTASPACPWGLVLVHELLHCVGRGADNAHAEPGVWQQSSPAGASLFDRLAARAVELGIAEERTP